MQAEPGHDTLPPRPCSRQRTLAIVAVFPLAFVGAAFALDAPAALLDGLLAILRSRDTLTTDYMGLGGIGAALLNAGLLTLLAIAIYWRSGAAVGGAAVAALFLVLGFALFGKNLLNVWSIVLGVYLYARFKGDAFAPRNPYALKADFKERPPFFEVSPTHKARAWLLDPRAPKTDPPQALERLKRKEKKA